MYVGLLTTLRESGGEIDGKMVGKEVADMNVCWSVDNVAGKWWGD